MWVTCQRVCLLSIAMAGCGAGAVATLPGAEAQQLEQRGERSAAFAVPDPLPRAVLEPVAVNGCAAGAWDQLDDCLFGDEPRIVEPRRARAPRMRPRRHTIVEGPAAPIDTPATVRAIDRIYFGEGTAALPVVVASLDAFANLAIDNEVTLVVVARADPREPSPATLSAQRAESVRSYLVRRGVPDARIVIRPHVAERPSGTEPIEPDNRCVDLATE